MSSDEKNLLKDLFNNLSESKYLRENFHDHQFVYIGNLMLLDERLEEIDDIYILKNMFTYLKQRYVLNKRKTD